MSNTTFAETLRQLRVDKHLSQQQLAKRLFVDRSSIANWETGRRVPDEDMIVQIAEILEADLAKLQASAKKKEGKPHVILVDDEKIVLAGGLPVLEENLPGASVTGFNRPSDALAFAEKNKVAIAFLDIQMGQISGLDVCRDLLKINPRTNVIFLTAYMDYSFRAWDTGASGFEIKPLSAEKIQKQLSMLRYPVRGLV